MGGYFWKRSMNGKHLTHRHESSRIKHVTKEYLFSILSFKLSMKNLLRRITNPFISQGRVYGDESSYFMLTFNRKLN